MRDLLRRWLFDNFLLKVVSLGFAMFSILAFAGGVNSNTDAGTGAKETSVAASSITGLWLFEE